MWGMTWVGGEAKTCRTAAPPGPAECDQDFHDESGCMMNCPVCKDVTLMMQDRQGIEIDFCPKCRGVWLDRGELDKIIERSAQYGQVPADPRYSQNAPPPPQQQYRRDDDDYYKYKKKKSFWHELFD